MGARLPACSDNTISGHRRALATRNVAAHVSPIIADAQRVTGSWASATGTARPKNEAPRARRGGAMDSPIHIIKHCFKHRASKYYQYMGNRVVRDNPWLWQKQLKSRVQNKLRAAVSDESNTAARSFSRIDRKNQVGRSLPGNVGVSRNVR